MHRPWFQYGFYEHPNTDMLICYQLALWGHVFWKDHSACSHKLVKAGSYPHQHGFPACLPHIDNSRMADNPFSTGPATLPHTDTHKNNNKTTTNTFSYCFLTAFFHLQLHSRWCHYSPTWRVGFQWPFGKKLLMEGSLIYYFSSNLQVHHKRICRAQPGLKRLLL